MTNDPQQTAPAAIPWYHSAILRGILAAFFTQILARIASTYHIDLSLWGLNVDTCVQIALDGISAAALAYATHARTVKPIPQVTLTKSTADAINAAAAPGSVDPPTTGVKP